MSNPGNHSEFDQNNDKRYSHSHVEATNQEGQRMADPAEGRHGAADRSADPGVATPSEAAVIRECLRETHTYSRTERCGQSDKKGIPRVSCCQSSGEHWG